MACLVPGNRAIQAADGWTDLTPSSDSKMVYVSSSTGSDSNSGLSASSPVRTIAAGRSLLRDGYPDYLLLKRGDTWNETFGSWSRSGRSANEPMVISYYGSSSAARPRIAGGGSTFKLDYGYFPKYIALVGLHLQPTDKGFDSANNLVSDILIEGCLIEGGESGVVLSASTDEYRTRRIVIRRCVIVDNSVFGIYASRHDDLLIEQNVFDNNGTSNTHEHNLYISKGLRTIIRDNISTRGANYGLKFRGPHTDGVIRGNVFARNRNGLTIHTKLEGEVNIGVDFIGNVLTDMGSEGQMAGLHISGTQQLKINDNLFTHTHLGGAAGAAVHLGFAQYYDGSGDWPQIEHVEISNNTFFDYDNHFLQYSDDLPYDDVKVSRNIMQRPSSADGYYLIRHRSDLDPATCDYFDNVYHSTNPSDEWFRNGADQLSLSEWVAVSGETGAVAEYVSFSDPWRTLASYNASQGFSPSFEAFIAQARLQSPEYWRDAYNAPAIVDYFREGFDQDVIDPPADPDIDGNGFVGSGDLAILLGQWGTCAGCAADLDGDGIVGAADLAVILGNWDSPQGDPSGTCEGDLDLDGAVGPTELALVLGQWGPCSHCPQDFDEDGYIGPNDLVVVLGNWGPCP